MICARSFSGVASHGKHIIYTSHRTCENLGTKCSASKIWAPKLPRKRLWQFCRAQMFSSNFFTCSVTPCSMYAYHDFVWWFVSITWLTIDYSLVKELNIRLKCVCMKYKIKWCLSVSLCANSIYNSTNFIRSFWQIWRNSKLLKIKVLHTRERIHAYTLTICILRTIALWDNIMAPHIEIFLNFFVKPAALKMS